MGSKKHEIDEIAWLKAQVARLNDSLQHFDKKTNMLHNQTVQISKDLKACNERLRNIDEHEVEQYLDSIRARSKDLNTILRGYVNRSAVLTELSAYTAEHHPDRIGVVLAKIASLYDMEHEWWIRHEHLSIADWFELLSN